MAIQMLKGNLVHLKFSFKNLSAIKVFLTFIIVKTDGAIKNDLNLVS